MYQTRLRDIIFYNIRLYNYKNAKIFLDRLILKNKYRGNLFIAGNTILVSFFQAYTENLKPIWQIKNTMRDKTGSVTRTKETLRCYVTNSEVGVTREWRKCKQTALSLLLLF